MARVAAWPSFSSSFRTEQNSQSSRPLRACCLRTPENAPNLLPGLEIGEPVEGSLLYGPYFTYLCRALLSAAPELTSLPLDDSLAFQSTTRSSRPANVYNALYATERLRRVRVTYFDAGRSCQAFNALLYPDSRFDLPLLGIDLLSFGSNKILCVVDFIPLSQDPGYTAKHISRLAPLREDFASSCSQMSNRFFDKDTFVSEQMIFYRSDLGSTDPALQIPDGGLYKVYVQYVDAHLDILHKMEPDEARALCVFEQQKAYDRYLADRDPAFQVFNSYFGKQWTRKFCTDFLCPGLPMTDT